MYCPHVTEIITSNRHYNYYRSFKRNACGNLSSSEPMKLHGGPQTKCKYAGSLNVKKMSFEVWTKRIESVRFSPEKQREQKRTPSPIGAFSTINNTAMDHGSVNHQIHTHAYPVLHVVCHAWTLRCCKSRFRIILSAPFRVELRLFAVVAVKF